MSLLDGVRDRLRGLTHLVEDAVTGIRYRIEDGWDWLVSRRLPHLAPVTGSAVAGFLVGVVSVAVGWVFRAICSANLGTFAGGSFSLLAFIVLSFVAFMVGERLLAGFGVPDARVVSALSVLLVQLLLFLSTVELIPGGWAWLLVPALTPLAFVATSAALRAAERELV